jgi:hypothetical protein
MAVPEAIQKLVEKYTFHRDAYLRGQEFWSCRAHEKQHAIFLTQSDHGEPQIIIQEVAMIKYSPLRIIAHKLHINGRYPTDYRNRYTPRTSNVCPCLINFADPSDKTRHDRMVTLVTKMPGLNKKVQDALHPLLISRKILRTAPYPCETDFPIPRYSGISKLTWNFPVKVMTLTPSSRSFWK